MNADIIALDDYRRDCPACRREDHPEHCDRCGRGGYATTMVVEYDVCDDLHHDHDAPDIRRAFCLFGCTA